MIVTRSDSKKRLLEGSADSDICENTNPKQSKLESTSGHVINSDVIKGDAINGNVINCDIINGGVISGDVINCDVIDGGEGSLSPTDCSELQVSPIIFQSRFLKCSFFYWHIFISISTNWLIDVIREPLKF